MAASDWAERLKASKDYRGLAAIFNSTDWSDEFRWKKTRLAEEILQEAGYESVPSIVAELEKGGVGCADLATILVHIGDPTTVPVLKRMLDMGLFAAYSQQFPIKDFIDKYPQFHTPTARERCALCGKTRPVTELHRFGGEGPARFLCSDTCWDRRGELVGSKLGVGCPYYSRGMCTTQQELSLCSLREGSYNTSCHVYAWKKGQIGL